MLLQASTKSLDFSDVFKGESKTLPVTVIPWIGTDFDIVDVESSGPEFEVEVLPAHSIRNALRNVLESARDQVVEKFGSQNPAPDTLPWIQPKEPPKDPNTDMDKARTINVKILPTASVGRHSGVIKIHTNLEKKPRLDVRVKANVVGSIKVEPQRRDVGTVFRGQSKEAVFEISLREAAAVRIDSVETSVEHLSTELSESASGSEYELKVRVRPDAPVGRLRETVTLHTTDEDRPEIELGFYARIIEKR
jgi:hypothetical protein